MKVYIGADHAGFELKDKLISYLHVAGHETEDMGAHSLNTQDDYPDYIRLVAEKVAANPLARGIVIGGSGQGEAICANRIKGIRAAVYYGGTFDIAVLSREHNDANILSLGARFIEDDEAKEIVRVWLETPFSGDERHVRRIAKLDK